MIATIVTQTLTLMHRVDIRHALIIVIQMIRLISYSFIVKSMFRFILQKLMITHIYLPSTVVAAQGAMLET